MVRSILPIIDPNIPMIGRTLSHYRVLEQIGAGGMGIVYRAHDEQLERSVAIKVLTPGLLADEGARRRFRNEALSLAKLNHPNVATIFEIGNEDGIDFLVTEYIPGVTLDAKLAQGGLTMKEVTSLGTQLCLGLQAAHEQGVVHRDLKPGNLRLTPDGRLKILDFGLAQLMPKANSDSNPTVTLTKNRGITGTLPYMPPEQLRGEKTDFRSDLWSAGVVLFELATGQRPFPEPNAPVMINAILNLPAGVPSQLNAQVPTQLDSLVLKALEKDPDHRYQSAKEMSVDLERMSLAGRPGSQAVAEFPAASGTRSRGTATGGVKSGHAAEDENPGRKLWIGAGAALLLVLALGVFFLRGNFSSARKPAGAAFTVSGGRRSVAVLAFRNLSGKPEHAWLSGALSEMLTTELSAGGKLRTIPGENVARLQADLGLSPAETLSQETLTRIYQTLGSNLVVLGSYLEIGGEIRVDLRVQDTSVGESVGIVSKSFPEAKFLDLVKSIGDDLRQKCGVGELTSEDAAAVRALQPANPEAAKLYTEALTKLRTYDAMAARDLLQQVLAIDGKNVLAHSALASAWTQLGYDGKAEEQAKAAFELSKDLPRKDSLSIEAGYRESIHEWDKAVELYKSLWTVFPDDLEIGLRFADAQVSAGTGQAALSTIERLRKLPAPTGNDPRIDMAEARAQDSLSDYRKMRAAALRASDKAQSLRAKFLRAQAQLSQCWALRNLGEYTPAKVVGKQAQETLAAAGDLRGEARSLTCLGNVAADEGNLSEARAMHEQALTLARKIGAEKDVAGALNNIGNVLASQQALGESTLHYQESLEVATRIGDTADALLTQNNIAANLMLQGDFEGAEQMLQRSLATATQTGAQGSVVSSLGNLGSVAYYQGELQQARKYLDDSLAKSRVLGLKSDSALALLWGGDVLLAQGDLAGAEKDYFDSLALRTELGDTSGIASCQMSLADLALEKGDAGEAQATASRAARLFHKEKDADLEVAARDVVARSLLEQGKLAEAKLEVEVASSLNVQSQPARLSIKITLARLLAKQGKIAESQRILDDVLKRAAAMKLMGHQLLAQLAQSEIQVAAGDSDSARSNLRRLRSDAEKSGFRLVARKAATAENALKQKG